MSVKKVPIQDSLDPNSTLLDKFWMIWNAGWVRLLEKKGGEKRERNLGDQN